jgi:hypothetical protein
LLKNTGTNTGFLSTGPPPVSTCGGAGKGAGYVVLIIPSSPELLELLLLELLELLLLLPPVAASPPPVPPVPAEEVCV